jgi:hypothetical protein
MVSSHFLKLALKIAIYVTHLDLYKEKHFVSNWAIGGFKVTPKPEFKKLTA